MNIEFDPMIAVVTTTAIGGAAVAMRWLTAEAIKRGLIAAKRRVYHALKDDVCLGAKALEVVNLVRKDMAELLEMRTMLNRLVDEFKPDHGHSMKDYVIRLESAIANVQAGAEMASDATGALLWRADATGRVTWVSKAIKERLGIVNDSSYVGWAWLSVVHADDRARVRAAWEQAVEDMGEAQDAYRVATIDGTVIHVKSYARPVVVNGRLDTWQGRHSIVRIEKPHDVVA